MRIRQLLLAVAYRRIHGAADIQNPYPLIESHGHSGPEPNIDKKAQPFRTPLAFLLQWKVYFLPRFTHKQAQPRTQGLMDRPSSCRRPLPILISTIAVLYITG